jgi:hypothetical protein
VASPHCATCFSCFHALTYAMTLRACVGLLESFLMRKSSLPRSVSTANDQPMLSGRTMARSLSGSTPYRSCSDGAPRAIVCVAATVCRQRQQRQKLKAGKFTANGNDSPWQTRCR